MNQRGNQLLSTTGVGMDQMWRKLQLHMSQLQFLSASSVRVAHYFMHCVSLSSMRTRIATHGQPVKRNHCTLNIQANLMTISTIIYGIQYGHIYHDMFNSVYISILYYAHISYSIVKYAKTHPQLVDYYPTIFQILYCSHPLNPAYECTSTCIKCQYKKTW